MATVLGSKHGEKYLKGPISKKLYIVEHLEKCTDISVDKIKNPTTGKREKEYAFELKHWLEYTKIDIETKIL